MTETDLSKMTLPELLKLLRETVEKITAEIELRCMELAREE